MQITAIQVSRLSVSLLELDPTRLLMSSVLEMPEKPSAVQSQTPALGSLELSEEGI